MTAADFPFGLSQMDAASLLSHGLKLKEVRDLADVAMISAALRKTCGNQVRAAKLLGVHRNTLWKTMRELALPTERSAWR